MRSSFTAYNRSFAYVFKLNDYEKLFCGIDFTAVYC
ncbi:hypothetical protein Solca_2771 [Solitalea canadensis DSM 3403]|uniref:Uncharacterized protein n=1 Tax=Solitalea canadensis (strain ATCC 29591 / DSM 3403 / JCM 21819 / LMG 8368 / NBRC 15130 / NCIMB 12057 / USAM 9D) TaxID=929556 RepID=H8KS10_SOLCM|nr:hypothetical protein Solca_2771 [Solitalea canadensis DSM 3403]